VGVDSTILEVDGVALSLIVAVLVGVIVGVTVGEGVNDMVAL